MSKRVVAGAAVAAFAVVVATVAVFAGGAGGHLQKLPLGAAGGRAAAQDSAGATSAMLAPIRPVEYRVAGTLPALGGTAAAYKLSSSVTTAQVAKLARAFGLSGSVKEDPDGFVVHDAIHQLRVTKDASLPWSYGPYFSCADGVVSSGGGVSVGGPTTGGGASTDGTPPSASVKPGSTSAPDAPAGAPTPVGGCAVASGGGVATSGSVGSAGASGTATVNPAPPVEPKKLSPQPAPAPAPMPTEPVMPPRPTDLPTKVDAQRLATELLTKGGVDLTGAAVRTDDGYTSWSVSIDPSVAGRPVFGMPTSVSVGPRGVVAYASGFLGQPQSLGDYPLVGTPKGIERLKSGFAVGPQPMMGAAESGVATDGAPTRLPVDGTVAPQVRTITGARLGLSYVADYRSVGRGTGYLVPAYVFTLDDGSTTSVVAVTDDLLATTTGAGVTPDGKK